MCVSGVRIEKNLLVRFITHRTTRNIPFVAIQPNGNVGTSSPHRTNQHMQKDHKSQKNYQDWSFWRVRLATKMIGPFLLSVSLSAI